MTWVVGAFVEAWSELRIHRTRVLLSLIGVAVAVAALTGVVGLGSLAQQSLIESSERASGRPATLYITLSPKDGAKPDPKAALAAFEQVTERYSIDYASSVLSTSQRVQFVDGAVDVSTQIVDVPYGAMHRVPLETGRWFVDDDLGRLAPAVVINEVAWQRIGSPAIETHPTIDLVVGTSTVRAVVIGVTRAAVYDTFESMFLLQGAYAAFADPVTLAQTLPGFEVWVPVDLFEQLQVILKRDLAGELGSTVTVDIYRQDYASFDADPFGPIRSTITGIAVLVLALGALSLVNISLVTVRQRIREIGIRRSFGATAARVFFAVMMESVVATTVAGVVGVILAVLIVQNPAVQALVADGVSDPPPFPVDAAILGLVSSVVVGALAGLLPALVAVRVKVIDAIRY